MTTVISTYPELVNAVVRLVLETTTDVDARDHVAKCMQDRFGAPAHQGARIVDVLLPPKNASDV